MSADGEMQLAERWNAGAVGSSTGSLSTASRACQHVAQRVAVGMDLDMRNRHRVGAPVVFEAEERFPTGALTCVDGNP